MVNFGLAVLISQPSISCQVEGCQKVAFSVGGNSPGALCEGHLRDGMLRVTRNAGICRKTRYGDAIDKLQGIVQYRPRFWRIVSPPASGALVTSSLSPGSWYNVDTRKLSSEGGVARFWHLFAR